MAKTRGDLIAILEGVFEAVDEAEAKAKQQSLNWDAGRALKFAEVRCEAVTAYAMLLAPAPVSKAPAEEKKA